MDAFSYVSGVTSIVLALGIARLLVGTGKLMERRGQMRLYWVHFMWVANVFLFLAMEWWILFRWSGWTNWNFFLYLFLIASPTVAFLLCVMLFPDPINELTDFKRHFYANRRWFFALAALLSPLDLIDTTLKSYDHLLAQGPIYIVTLTLTASLSIIAASTNNEKYHKFYSVFFFVYLLAFITINLNLLA
jgi:hypothetical protein